MLDAVLLPYPQVLLACRPGDTADWHAGPQRPIENSFEVVHMLRYEHLLASELQHGLVGLPVQRAAKEGKWRESAAPVRGPPLIAADHNL